MSDNYFVHLGNDRLSFFTNGAWMEPQGILGVIDDMHTFYLINSNGREIMRSTMSELKLNVPIIDLVVLVDVNSKKSYLSAFGIFTTDGLIHSFEVSKEPRSSISPLPTLNNPLKDRLPQNVSCLDYHPNLSMIVLVDAFKASGKLQSFSGLYSLYLLRMATNLDPELVFCSPQFEGLFSSPKGHLVSLTSPKVSISPQGKYIAALDLTGCVDLFCIDSDSLSVLSFAERLHSHYSDSMSRVRKNNLKDIIDISWWTDHVLILINSSGFIIMYDVLNDKTVLKDDRHVCMPVIEKPKNIQGHVFVLEARSCEGGPSKPEQTGNKNSININQFYDSKLHWSLLSISGRSVSEMYSILIHNQQYHSALEFADRHGLDRDEVIKAQWLSSCYGIQDVDLLAKINDRIFVLSECIGKVGPTEGAVKALLSYGIYMTEDYLFSNFNNEESCLPWDFWIARLQLLQYRDKLDTFVGINMGRFSAEEYSNFRAVPVTNAAINLAENGKIGSLNLLFKRHPYSLSQDVLHVLSAIPETVPVQSYVQLLPGKSPPATVALRERDWVECEQMISFFDKMPGGSEKIIKVRTENILKLSVGFVWPSSAELVDWYINRAKDIDVRSGQLENCFSLVESACHKGILELQQFLEDITYLRHLIYADEYSEDYTMGLVVWEQLPDYEKFKMLLKRVTVDSVVETLQEKAIPFMQKRFHHEQVNSVEQIHDVIGFMHYEQSDSFLVRWMKELASSDKLDICLKVIENGCRESLVPGLFKDETEIVETALGCIYLCALTDQWNVMASILSKLPRKALSEKTLKDTTPKCSNLGSGTPRFSYIRSHLSKSVRKSNPLSMHEEDFGQYGSGGTDLLVSSVASDDLEKRINIAEGHVEVGRLLAYYQVQYFVN